MFILTCHLSLYYHSQF